MINCVDDINTYILFYHYGEIMTDKESIDYALKILAHHIDLIQDTLYYKNFIKMIRIHNVTILINKYNHYIGFKMRYIIITSVKSISELISFIDIEHIDIASFICYDIPFSKQTISINKNIYPCYSYEYLEEAVRDMYFDCCIIYGYSNFIKSELEKLNVDKGKILDASIFPSHFFTRPARIMNKIVHNIDSYSVILTGMSYARDAFDQNFYDMQIATCIGSSQDLYYDLKYAQYFVQNKNHHFSYAIISLAPYSLHYDLSLSKNESFFIPAYYLVFNDVHNYFISNDDMEKLFSNQLIKLSKSIYTDIISPEIDLNDAYNWKKQNNHSIDTNAQLNARSRSTIWNNRYYPMTLEENKSILNEMIQLYIENNCDPIIVLYPFSNIYRHFFNKKIIDELYYIIRYVIKYYNINFIDLFSVDFINDNDFYNVDHLNSSGSKKVSKYINNFICSHK